MALYWTQVAQNLLAKMLQKPERESGVFCYKKTPSFPMKITVFGEVINLKKITTGDKFMVDKNEDSAPESDGSEVTIFDKKIESVSDNELDFQLEDFPALNTKMGVFERVLNRVERLVVVLFHKIFDEVEAATYLRLPDPEHQGRETVRNYALRSKKISYYKIGRNGLTFLKADLDMAMGRFKVQSFRDL